ncbi:MAG: addiction module protein [Chitinophagaceae bacterium]|jgi:hypothetical protein|nr:addiction module protein [Chitinophagaceae bacterium]
MIQKEIYPQYTLDNTGNPVGVFLPIEDWNAISEQLQWELPDWQKKILDERLGAYAKNPDNVIDLDTFIEEEL